MQGAHTTCCPVSVCGAVCICVWDNEPTLPFCLSSEPAAVPLQIIFPGLLTEGPNSVCV